MARKHGVNGWHAMRKVAPGGHMPERVDADKIIAANTAYYKALSARDMDAMAKVWTRANDNILIAPPVDPDKLALRADGSGQEVVSQQVIAITQS